VQHTVETSASSESATSAMSPVRAGTRRHGVGVSGGQVVRHDHLVAGLDQSRRATASGVSGTAGYHNLTAFLASSTRCRLQSARPAACGDTEATGSLDQASRRRQAMAPW